MEPENKITERQWQSAATVKTTEKECVMKIHPFNTEPRKKSMSSHSLQINPSPLLLTQLKRRPEEIEGIWKNYMNEAYKGNFPEQDNQAQSSFISLDKLFQPPVTKTEQEPTKKECDLLLFNGFLNQKEETNTDVVFDEENSNQKEDTSKKNAFAKTTSDSLDIIKNIPNVESEQPNVLKTFTTFLELSSSDSNSHSDSDRREESKEERKEESKEERKEERKKIKKYDFTSI